MKDYPTAVRVTGRSVVIVLPAGDSTHCYMTPGYAKAYAARVAQAAEQALNGSVPPLSDDSPASREQQPAKEGTDA